jgi:hypothetical protein
MLACSVPVGATRPPAAALTAAERRQVGLLVEDLAAAMAEGAG